MKKFLFLCLFTTFLYSQNNIDKALDDALLYRGLTRNDITIPLDTSDYANTNQSKELLPVVYKLMTQPLYSNEFMDKVMGYKNVQLEQLIENLYIDAGYDFGIDVISDLKWSNNISDLIADICIRSGNNYRDMLKVYEASEKSYILNNLKMLYENAEGDDESSRDIYKMNAVSDSATYVAKRVLDLLSRLSKADIYRNGKSDMIFFLNLYRFLRDENVQLEPGTKNYSDGLTVVIGTAGNDTYNGKYDVIIEPGGNDVYELERDYRTDNFPCCIIDLAGDDLYKTGSKYSVASSVFTSGFLFDKEGNDVYRLGSCNLAAAVGGFAMLYDESGDDIYEGKDFSVAAALFGCSLLYDRAGNDIYTANTFSQGFGMTNGVAAVVDIQGNDNYMVNPSTLDVLRYSDHYLSMCQGYGYGLRPYYAGGVGYIIEGEGNDVYACDIFGQGGSYWYSLGCIVDGKGNDKYTGFHYNQGSGIHLSVGLMKDYAGWDYYNSNWVSQGCGHDYALGVLWDVSGSDLYACDGLSQGAGNANGIGMLIDESGRDGYLSKDLNTQGYGQPSRGFGSIGILLDNSGSDYYSRRQDSVFINGSNWGIRLDNDMPEPVVQTQPEGFKVSVDTTLNYSMDDLYMFARTMEIQFQNYSGFAFERMVRDSVSTVQYILPKLNSEDIRDIVLIRNFVPRIGYTMSNEFIKRLNDYTDKKLALTQDEINFMIFMIGESKNPGGKDILMKFTYDSRYRVRASAVTALSKLPVSGNSSELLKRLKELFIVNSDRQLYNKDLSLALRVVNSDEAVPVLIDLLKHPYFGVRFNAAGILSSLGDGAYKYYTREKLKEIAHDGIWTVAFLSALEGLSEDKAQGLYRELEKNSNDRIVKMSIKEKIHGS